MQQKFPHSPQFRKPGGSALVHATAPSTVLGASAHTLGAGSVKVVKTVTKQWLEQAKAGGRQRGAGDHGFGGGCHRHGG